jgi:thiol-disulfide isomerase/thioredoxin
MLERLIVAGILMALGTVVYCMVQRCHLSKLAKSVELDPILSDLKRDVATIVYFTTPMCIPCKTQQQPALRELQAELGDDSIQIVQIDATQDPSVAERWGVMSAPTTFVLDKMFQPKHINHGVADVNKLKRQLGITAA